MRQAQESKLCALPFKVPAIAMYAGAAATNIYCYYKYKQLEIFYVCAYVCVYVSSYDKLDSDPFSDSIACLKMRIFTLYIGFLDTY